MNPNTSPTDGSTGAQSAPQPENGPSGAETTNGPQAGAQGFVPGWAPHMDAYAKNFPAPSDSCPGFTPSGLCQLCGDDRRWHAAPAPAALRDQIAEMLAGHAGSRAFLTAEPGWDHARAAWYAHADAVLRVPAIAEALAAVGIASALHRSAEQDVTRVIELADAWAHRPERQDALQELRAALQSGWQQ